MGASKSKNVADAITNVSNYVENKTEANASQVSKIQNKILFENCDVQGNVNANTVAKVAQSSSQIVTAMQNANIENDIQQKMLQEAVSAVGSLGLGYADASNSSSMFVNASTEVINAMTAGVSQYSSIDNTFHCENSTLHGDVNIDFSSEGDFLSQQTLNNQQTASIINKVSQTAEQKAKAEVAGLASFLVALALVILALGYSVSKSATSVLNTFPVILLIIVLFFACSFLYKWPPYFNDYKDCIPGGTNCGSASCSELKETRTSLSEPPLRYIYPLLPSDFSKSGANLLQIVISSVGGGNIAINGGYNKATYLNLENLIKNYQQYAIDTGIDLPPNPLKLVYSEDGLQYKIPIQYLKGVEGRDAAICTPGAFMKHVKGKPGDFNKCPRESTLMETVGEFVIADNLIMANLNDKEWEEYLSFDDDSHRRAKFARFMLVDMLNLPLSIYIDSDEFVKCKNKNGDNVIGLAKNVASNYDNYCYQLKIGDVYDFRNALPESKGGELIGMTGFCNDQMYKFSSFMRGWGWLIIGIILLLVIVMMWWRSRSQNGDVRVN